MKRAKGRHHPSSDIDGTDELRALLEQELDGEPQIDFLSPGADDDESQPHWRVLFELASNPAIRFGVDIRGEVILGRGHDLPNLIDLTPYGAQDCGVSRQHVRLRPTPSKLYVIDEGSTNGTLRNGNSIGVHTPYGLNDRDTLSLGRLQLVTHFLERPKSKTTSLRRRADFGSALIEIAASLTSQLDIDDVLSQIAEVSMALTSAEEVGIWLVDEKTGEAFLEAQRGIDEDKVKRLRLPVDSDSLVAQVIKTGQPLRASGDGDESIKVDTGYFVSSIVYVPLTLAGITFGVLSAAHHAAGKQFDERDERFLGVVAHFAAIALQNARLFHIADEALEKRVSELAALNELSQAVSRSLDLDSVTAALVEQIEKLWTVDVAGMWLAVGRGQQTVYTSAHGSKLLPDTDATSSAIARLVAQCAATGEPMLANNVQYQPNPGKDKRMTIMVAGSAVCTPLIVQQDVVGVLLLFKKGRARFADEDMERLQSFANPVATAIHNARLFEQSEHERATIRATAKTLSQPLLIVGERDELLITNDAANQLLASDMSQVFEGIRMTQGRTDTITVGDHKYLTSVHLEDGVGTIAIMQDITDLLNAEDALRASEERYRLLVETSPEAIIVTNLDGKIMVCNAQAAVLFGLKGSHEAINLDMFEFIAPEDRQRAGENLISNLENETIRNIEYVILKADGTRCPVVLSTTLLHDRGLRPIGFIQVAWDISHIKQMERARADFMHALSHDLKSPISAIKGWTELIERQNGHASDVPKFTERIRHTADTTLAMIDQLLDIASLNEAPSLHLAPCDLDEIVAKAISDVEGAATAKAIEMHLTLTGKPRRVMADRSRLYRSTLNLLDNAIKYSPPNTVVAVALNYADGVELTVCDGGPGIPDEDLEHVFEKFFRGVAAAGSIKGAGLGLATVQAAIEAHSGKITVRNSPDGGAEFRIKLPARAMMDAPSRTPT